MLLIGKLNYSPSTSELSLTSELYTLHMYCVTFNSQSTGYSVLHRLERAGVLDTISIITATRTYLRESLYDTLASLPLFPFCSFSVFQLPVLFTPLNHIRVN